MNNSDLLFGSSLTHSILAPACGVSFGKLILSGEHAVVHGCPALVASLPFETKAFLHPTPATSSIEMDLPDLDRRFVLTWEEACFRVQKTKERHQLYAQGLLPITEVLADPSELALVAALSLAPRGGWSIRLTSDVPVRAGLGSSAAAIVAVLRAVDEAFRLETPLSRLWQIGKEVESFQHGRSSGTDIAAALYGGLQRFQNGHVIVLDRLSLPEGWQLWYSGQPLSSTGEAVSHVGKQFSSQHALWKEFSILEDRAEEALRQGDWHKLGACVRNNHRLLYRIGVVPEAVHQAITTIESWGGSAKICGAGAIRGDGAGAVLVLPPTLETFPPSPCFLHWKRMI